MDFSVESQTIARHNLYRREEPSALNHGANPDWGTDMRRASKIAGPLLVVIATAMGRPAVAQGDLSGEWAGTIYEDLPHRGDMQLGDYTGPASTRP